MEEEMSGTGAGEVATLVPVAETPATIQRGRGRPRKPVQEPVDPAAPKRPRGRPRGSKNKTHRATPTEPPKEKRPRGRPRKWPQKEVQQQELQVQEGEIGQEENLQPPLPAPEEYI